MRRVLTALAACLLLFQVLTLSQGAPKPGAFSTVVTTNTGANSLNVGCAITSTTCTGGIDAGSVALSSTGATAIDVEGGITAGSGNVGIVNTAGKIPALSSTYFADLSGANLTGVAFSAGTQSISATWTLDNNIPFQSRNTAASAVNVATVSSGNFLILGPTDAQVAGGVGVSTAITGSSSVSLVTNQVSRTTIGSTGALTHNNAVAWTGVISPSALASGSTNNYNPASLASSSYVILTADAGGSTLTGLAAQASGTEITLCEPAPGAGSLTIAHESGSSTAANRFNNGAQANITLNKDTSGGVGGPCVTYWYYGAGARWLLKSTSTSVP